MSSNIINFDESKDDMEIGRWSFCFNGYDREGRITFSLEERAKYIQPEKATIIHLPTFVSKRNIVAFHD